MTLQELLAYIADGIVKSGRLAFKDKPLCSGHALIVGLGGTGSLIAEQLAHLAVTDFLLIDPDTVDETNLNRRAGASGTDIGTAKTEVAVRLIRSVNPRALAEPVCRDVTEY